MPNPFRRRPAQYDTISTLFDSMSVQQRVISELSDRVYQLEQAVAKRETLSEGQLSALRSAGQYLQQAGTRYG